jgi:hypothetical protein
MKPTAVGQLFLAGVLFFMASCTLGDRTSGEPSGLPTASADLRWATVNLSRGTYCWNSAGHGACADSAPPDVLLQKGYLKPYRTAGGYRVQIKFHANSVATNSKIELLSAPSGGSGSIKESAPLAIDLPVIPSQGPGVYVYLVTGTWKEGSASFYLVLDEIPGGA